MTIRGSTKNVAFSPQANKEIDPEESFIPYRNDWRNVVLTDAGNRKMRPGYDQAFDVGVDEPVHALVPFLNGYAITDTSKLYELTATPTDRSGTGLGGTSRPQFTIYNDLPIVVDGGTPAKIQTTLQTLLGSPPLGAKFVDTLGPYTLMCGQNDYEFRWSSSNNPEEWLAGDSGFATVKKDGKIKSFKVLAEKAYFFKDQSIEIWYNRGGATPFVRFEYIERGIHAPYSLVKESNVLYFLGNDLRFYRLEGINPKFVSSPFESYIQNIEIEAARQIYGYNYFKEHLIKWFSPVDGKCMVHDYKHNQWSEDNRWEGSGWQRVPVNSYMELNNTQYIGSYNNDGLVHEWSPEFKDDDGHPIRMYENFVVRASDKGHRSRYNKVQYRLKRGVATATVTDPVFTERHRLDRGPWSIEEQISLGQTGDYDPYISRYNLGIGRDIEFEIVNTDAVDWLMSEMQLTARSMGS